MKIHDLEQGSPEWHAHRRTHFNASDAPAMLGISPYKTRNQLLDEFASGVAPEVDSATQRLFDQGHRFEALARPLAAKIIGEDLGAIVISEGQLSASLDGITFDGTKAFEHKKLNNEIRRVFENNEPLPEYHRCQMEQQLICADGCEAILFMATEWDEHDNLIGEPMHRWYTSDHEMRQRIIDGWAQFEKDLADHKPRVTAEMPKAETIIDLPALSVQATGMVTHSNLPEFKAAAQAYIANINTDLQTDNDFATAEATVKFCKSTEEKLEVTKSAILAQTATIDEVIRTVDNIQAQLRDKRLQLDKLVKSEKESRKIEMVRNASDRYTAHVTSLQSEIGGVQFLPLLPRQDFGVAIKGLKSLASMHDALDNAVANGKIAADAIAKDVRDKLAWCKDNAAGMSFLFPDLQQIIVKPLDDFKLVITTRIEQHKKAESAKLEAERERIRQEEEAKARARVITSNTPPEIQSGTLAEAPPAASPQKEHAATVKRPTRMQLIEAIAAHYGVSVLTADEWLRTEFAVVAA